MKHHKDASHKITPISETSTGRSLKLEKLIKTEMTKFIAKR